MQPAQGKGEEQSKHGPVADIQHQLKRKNRQDPAWQLATDTGQRVGPIVIRVCPMYIKLKLYLIFYGSWHPGFGPLKGATIAHAVKSKCY